MLFTGRKPDDIAGPNFRNWPAFALRPPETRRDDQRLTERMCMPGGASTRLERDARAAHMSRFGCLEKRVNANYARKPINWSFARWL